MHNANTWFEIPVRNLAAARRFYEAMLDCPMHPAEDVGGDTMVVFAHEKPGASGCIVERPTHRAASGGTVVYLDSAPSVAAALERAQPAGGRVVVARTLIAPGIGYFAQVQDPEGNLIGLHAAD